MRQLNKKNAALLAGIFFLVFLSMFPVGEADKTPDETEDILETGPFPSRPIKLYFPWSASGGSFAVSQVVATAMSKELGQPVTVLSTPGATGLKAFKVAQKEAADGYTMIDGYLGPLVMLPLQGKADYTYEDFKPLHFVASNAFAIVSRADETRWHDFYSMLDYLEAHPGQTVYSAGPDLSLPHLSAAVIMRDENIISRYVPYGGTNAAVKEFRSGLIDWMVINTGSYKANAKHFRVEAVLTDTEQAREWYGNAPSIQSLGYDYKLEGLAAVGWTWWVVDKDTPDAVVEKLREAQLRALENPQVREKVSQLGFSMDGYRAPEYDEKLTMVANQLEFAIDSVAWEKNAIQDHFIKSRK